MTPTGIRTAVVTEKVAWVRQMTANIRKLPIRTYGEFVGDPRNPAAAESYLRRGLESLLDLGRHVLARGCGVAATDYKDVAEQLAKQGVIGREEGQILRMMAGYRNRLVHLYHEISFEELYNICTSELEDVERVSEAILKWLRDNPDRIDTTI
jgi:uncharacterized protein YutE (UPF0331/DUF86 family)